MRTFGELQSAHRRKAKRPECGGQNLSCRLLAGFRPSLVRGDLAAKRVSKVYAHEFDFGLYDVAGTRTSVQLFLNAQLKLLQRCTNVRTMASTAGSSAAPIILDRAIWVWTTSLRSTSSQVCPRTCRASTKSYVDIVNR